MPRVTAETVIAAPLEKVWELAQDVEHFPDIIPDLVSVKTLEREQTSPETLRTVTEWMGRIKQFNRSVHWVEEDIWNESERICHFWQIRGDYDEYRGIWKFEPQGASTRALLEIDYRFDVPLLGPLIKKVTQKLMQESSNAMLAGLKSAAEQQGSGFRV
jgi:ribosome-associated toxin RatA of RatAB toxin-antitoxin module